MKGFLNLILPVLAEVGDKIPRLPVVFLWSAGISLLAWVLIRKRKWLAPLPGTIAVLFAFVATAEPRDEFVGPAIVQELGHGYAVLCYVASSIPILVIAVLLPFRKKR